MSKIAKFGFEIEGEFSEDFRRELQGVGVMKGDGSVRNCPDCGGLATGEFNSRPYLLSEIDEAKAVLKMFQKAHLEKKYHWNDSAGLHVHVSFSPKKPPEIMCEQFADYFKNGLTSKYPTVVRKRGDNYYCKMDYDDAYILDPQRGNRYRAMNYQSFQKHGTLEFRIFPTARPTRMWDFIQFTLGTINNWFGIGCESRQNSEIDFGRFVGKEHNHEMNVRLRDIGNYDIHDTNPSVERGKNIEYHKNVQISDSN